MCDPDARTGLQQRLECGDQPAAGSFDDHPPVGAALVTERLPVGEDDNRLTAEEPFEHAAQAFGCPEMAAEPCRRAGGHHVQVVGPHESQ
jgi:hypothetical protein